MRIMLNKKKKLPIDNGNPAVKFFFDEMHRKGYTESDVAMRIGLDKVTLGNWRRRTMPRIDNIEAALNFLGYHLEIKQNEER